MPQTTVTHDSTSRHIRQVDMTLFSNFPTWWTTPVCFVFCLLVFADESHGQTNVSVSANSHRFIGGVSQLDRAQYFNFTNTLQGPSNSNLGNLRSETYVQSGLNATTGRIDTELDDFIAKGLPEDPSKPDYFLHGSLINRIQDEYRNFVLAGTRWEGLRDGPDPIIVQSGRNGGFWPDFLDDGGPMPTNYDAYADFMKTYLEEAVYGEGLNQSFLPVDPDRFYFEIMNEPNWSSFSTGQWDEVIEMHQVVTEELKEPFPQLKIGGPSCCDDLGDRFNGWERAQKLMDDMTNWQTSNGQSVELDFWTLHPYERYDVAANGSYSQATFTSPGHVSAILDLYESYSHIKFGDPKAFAITEYGSFNRTNMADGSYGDYSRPAQQWDLVRDIREKMMVFLDRPDRIIAATPHVFPRDWRIQQIPTHPDGDNVFWEQDTNGEWGETIVASMFRMFNDVSGKYIGVSSDNQDLQTVAFRDGNQVHVILNNLEKSSNTINLQTTIGPDSVIAASLDRIFWDGTSGIYESDLDVATSWQNLTLAAEEGAVLTLTLDGSQFFDSATNQRTFYGDDVITPLTLQRARSKIINIQAELDDALAASVRVAFNREEFSPGQAFRVFVNGTGLSVPAEVFEFDDSDTNMVTREIDVPLNLLNDGNNEIFADFQGKGGDLITTVLTVTQSIGDFNGSGAFDNGDLRAIFQEFGPVAAGNKYDLTKDGVVDIADIDFWHVNLRGMASIPMCDVNHDGMCDDHDIDEMTQFVLDGVATEGDRQAFIESPFPQGLNTWIGDSDMNGEFDEQDFVAVFNDGKYLTGEQAGWAQGDWDGNFLADEQDVVAAFVAGGYLRGQRPVAVPEPSSFALISLGALAICVARRR